MSYKNETGTFQASKDDDGTSLNLFYQRWIPASPKPGFDLIVHHGLGEHSGRWAGLLAQLEGTGISVYSYDVRGHGQSAGKKGLAKGTGQLADDLGAFVTFLKEKYNVTKPLIYGHSMGGAVVLRYLGQSKEHQDQFCAVVATGPALGVDKTCYQTVMSTALNCLKGVVPSLCLDSGLDTTNLSKDKNVVDSYRKDPLTHGLISVSLAFSILLEQETILNSAATMTLPIFMAHGEADKLTSPSGTKAYFQKCASTKKTLILYPGAFHELHNEVKEDREKFFADVKPFIIEQLSSKK